MIAVHRTCPARRLPSDVHDLGSQVRDDVFPWGCGQLKVKIIIAQPAGAVYRGRFDRFDTTQAHLIPASGMKICQIASHVILDTSQCSHIPLLELALLNNFVDLVRSWTVVRIRLVPGPRRHAGHQPKDDALSGRITYIS